MTAKDDPVLSLLHGKTPTEIFALLAGIDPEEIEELGGLPGGPS